MGHSDKTINVDIKTRSGKEGGGESKLLTKTDIIKNWALSLSECSTFRKLR